MEIEFLPFDLWTGYLDPDTPFEKVPRLLEQLEERAEDMVLEAMLEEELDANFEGIER